jgi:CheY-like chemotaxis protein
MNGLQLIEALKHGEHELKVPFIILTKQLDDEIEMQYYRLGAEKIVNLPYDQDDLLQHLKSVLL